MSEKIPADKGGRKEASGGRAGHAPKGPAGKGSGEKLNERPGKGYGGQEGGNAGKGPKNKGPGDNP